MNLIYTVAYDLPGWRGSRTMAKLLCSSLLRGFWSGEILVFRNFAQPLFPVERKGLGEVFIETPDFGEGREAGEKCLQEALRARFGAVEWIDKPERYEWIAYLDADCLALRDVEHLFAGDADLLVQPERGRSMRDSAVFNGYLDLEEAGDPPPAAEMAGWGATGSMPEPSPCAGRSSRKSWRNGGISTKAGRRAMRISATRRPSTACFWTPICG